MPEYICFNCGQPPHKNRKWLQLGMCGPCYNFWRRHGVMRNETTMIRLPPGSNRCLCKNCRQAIADVKQLCDTCYKYELTTGKRRPKHLWREECKNCKKPRMGPRSFRRGRCKSCDHHWRKYKAERPLEAMPLWCDCGHLATHVDVPLRITLGTGYDIVEKYNLCDDCWQLEQSY